MRHLRDKSLHRCRVVPQLLLGAVLAASVSSLGTVASANPPSQGGHPPKITIFWFIKASWRAKTENLVEQVEEGLRMDERVHFVPFDTLLVPPEKADAQLEKAKETLQASKKALFELDMDKALQLAKKAVGIYEASFWRLLDSPFGVPPLVAALAHLAEVAHQSGDTNLRRSALSLVLALEPDWKPPKEYAADLSEPIMNLKLERDELGTSSLVVTTKPKAGVVYVDGKKVGRAPVTVQSLKEGDHLVTIRRRGFRPVTRVVAIKPPDKAEIEVALEPVSKKLFRNLKLALANLGKAVADHGTYGAGKQLGVDVLCLARVLLHGSEATLVVVAYDMQNRRLVGSVTRHNVDVTDVSVDATAIVRSLVDAITAPKAPPKPKVTKKPKHRGPSWLTRSWRKFRRSKAFWWVWGGVGGAVVVGLAVGLGLGFGLQHNRILPGSRHLFFLRGRSPAGTRAYGPRTVLYHW